MSFGSISPHQKIKYTHPGTQILSQISGGGELGNWSQLLNILKA